MPGQPDRAVALKRRETAELLAEELRRLDPDNTYEASLKFGVSRLSETAPAAPAAEAAPAATEAPAEAAEAEAPAEKPAAKPARASKRASAK